MFSFWRGNTPRLHFPWCNALHSPSWSTSPCLHRPEEAEFRESIDVYACQSARSRGEWNWREGRRSGRISSPKSTSMLVRPQCFGKIRKNYIYFQGNCFGLLWNKGNVIKQSFQLRRTLRVSLSASLHFSWEKKNETSGLFPPTKCINWKRAQLQTDIAVFDILTSQRSLCRCREALPCGRAGNQQWRYLCLF